MHHIGMPFSGNRFPLTPTRSEMYARLGRIICVYDELSLVLRWISRRRRRRCRRLAPGVYLGVFPNHNSSELQTDDPTTVVLVGILLYGARPTDLNLHLFMRCPKVEWI